MLGDKKLIKRLDEMLQAGIDGTFEETSYDETQLSKLETKWLRYLSTSKLTAVRAEQERQKLKELVSDISHQTKTPIANILLYTQLLQEQDLNEQSRQLLGEISAQSQKLDFLIQSLVKISRLETGTFTLTPTENRIDAPVRSALSQLGPSAKAKGIAVDYSPTAAKAVFDIKWTAEALFNILDNAVKYSPNESTVNVSIEEFEMFAAVCVKDEGIGIPEAELPLIFGRFYRGQNVREKDGVGIGLYLSRRMIEEQGGYVTAASEQGRGSVFKVFLPK